MRRSVLVRTGVAALAMGLFVSGTVMAEPGDNSDNSASTGQYSLNTDGVGAEEVMAAAPLSAGVSSVLDEYYDSVESGDFSRSMEVELGAMLDEEVANRASVLDDYTRLGITTVNNYLNVRDLPSTDNTKSEIIGKMVHYTACEILDYADGWYKVQSGPVVGYVAEEYVVEGDEAIEIALEEAKLRAIVKTEKSDLNVRKEPSTDSKILEKVSSEERYEVLEVLDGWVKIATLTGEEGYVSADYVEVKYALNEAVEFTPPMTTSKRQQIIDYAMQFLGNRYVFGGTSLTRGTDCSGFTMRVFQHFGISLSRTSKAQANNGRTISDSEIQPGDLIFYGRSGVSGIGHVAIYIGNGKIVHAASSRTGIIISNARFTSIIKVVNVID